jgi:hypothetical protein
METSTGIQYYDGINEWMNGCSELDHTSMTNEMILTGYIDDGDDGNGDEGKKKKVTNDGIM